MSQIFDATTLNWQPVRPEITRGVFGKTLLDGKIKAVLTRVAPGGKFEMHRDQYAHLFYFLSGEGKVWVGGKQFAARAGLVAQIDVGDDHAYENVGNEDLILLSLNIPVE
ncbi:MAG: cupin domain-containing protein [Chloroflexota bacterium]